MVYGLGLAASAAVGAVALAVLVYGAEVVVDKLTAIAAFYDIPDVIIAMSVVSIGTSLPEIVSHAIASAGILNGTLDYEIASATVLGANIGSDVVQQTLVVGLVILGYIGIRVRREVDFTQAFRDVMRDVAEAANSTAFTFETEFLKKDYFPMIGTTLMCTVLGWDGVYSRIDGLVLFGSFIGYMYYLFYTRGYRYEQREESSSVRWDGFIVAVGMLGVIGSAHVLLTIVEEVVAATGLGGSLIGVVTLGIASALPEMFTALSGLRHQAEGISLGTLIGSNITNPLVAIGGGALISTYWVPRPLVLWDLPMETVTAAMLLAYLLFVSDQNLGWKGGLYLVGLYAVYLIVRVQYFAVD